MASSDPDLFEGLICISPAFQSIMRFSLSEYVSIFSSALYNPKKQFEMPFDSTMCTRDGDMCKKMDNDPREHRLASAALLFETAKAQVASAFRSRRIKVPVLFLLAEEDSMISAGIAEKIYDRLRVEDKSIIVYPGMRHALSIELGREEVFQDILEWLRERSSSQAVS